MSECVYPMARAANGSNDPSMTRLTAVGTTGQVLKAAPGRFYGACAVNKAATAYYLMVFDKATAPVNGDTPRLSKPLPVSGAVTIGPEDMGGFSLGCLLGIGVAISTTPDTLTLAASADLTGTFTWK